MRVDLSDLQPGAWAEIYDKVPWGLMRQLVKYAGADDADPSVNIEVAGVLLRQLVKEWEVKDLSGTQVAIPKHLTDEELDTIEGEILQKIAGEARVVISGVRADPKSTASPSPSSQEGSPSTP